MRCGFLEHEIFFPFKISSLVGFSAFSFFARCQNSEAKIGKRVNIGVDHDDDDNNNDSRNDHNNNDDHDNNDDNTNDISDDNDSNSSNDDYDEDDENNNDDNNTTSVALVKILIGCLSSKIQIII